MTIVTMDKEIFTTFEVGKLCQVFHTTVINWINKGQLKAYTTPGKHRRIQKSDLLEFMKHFNIRIPPELAIEKKKKIFVVDDDPAIRRLLQRTFSTQSDSIQLVAIGTGIEALVAVGKDVPDLIILDIGMPGMDGFEVCRSLRSIPGNEKIKIIVITGRKLSHEQEKFLKKNVDEIFLKPFSPSKLCESALSILGMGVLT